MKLLVSYCGLSSGTAAPRSAKLKTKLPSGKQPVVHSLRHTYFTEFKRIGVPIAVISQLAGHSSIQITGICTGQSARPDGSKPGQGPAAAKQHRRKMHKKYLAEAG